MRLPVNHCQPLVALFLVAQVSAAQAATATGPAADYPVVVGEPFTIGSITWTPADQLSYDAVGHAVVGDGTGTNGAHKTLPLPSYVEVTALDSGRTILVRLERRGPMVNDAMVELSADAATQLGLAPGSHAPVRVRRVNPPEVERAALRSGGKAPARMETPEGLLKVLRRKLAEQSPLLPPPSTPPTMPKGPLAQAAPVPAAPPLAPATRSTPRQPIAVAPQVAAAKTSAKPEPAEIAKPKPPTHASVKKGGDVVQVGAFSVETNAQRAAKQVGADVTRAGKFWRVQMGPFANRAQAAAALEKARAAGYSDARIQRAD
ncbi:MAG: SPOR domain-containing protein [Novosphingobium sp.]|nr:SPOR domain-containing protein [Novosphingobium sp.]